MVEEKNINKNWTFDEKDARKGHFKVFKLNFKFKLFLKNLNNF